MNAVFYSILVHEWNVVAAKDVSHMSVSNNMVNYPPPPIESSDTRMHVFQIENVFLTNVKKMRSLYCFHTSDLIEACGNGIYQVENFRRIDLQI